MTSNPKLDPRAHAAIEHIRAHAADLTGPILLRGLVAALPGAGYRRSWRDAVTVFLLCELVGVHRVAKSKNPFFRGPLYQVNRTDVAKQFACEPDQISSSLTWLKNLGLVEVIHRTHIDAVGKPCGTQVYAVPAVQQIQSMLTAAADGRPMSVSNLFASNPFEGSSKSPTGRPEDSLKEGSTHVEDRAYLNSSKAQQKSSADGVGWTTVERRGEEIDQDAQWSPADDEGGGEADADQSTQVPPSQDAASPYENTPTDPASQVSDSRLNSLPGSDVRGCDSATPSAVWTAPAIPADYPHDDESKDAWIEAASFCALWAEAIQRMGHLEVCKTTHADMKASFRYFLEEPQTGSFRSVAVAISAWRAANTEKESNWDEVYHCRGSLDIRTFLRHHQSGKILTEIRKLGWTVNTYKDLRECFTDSELRWYGWFDLPILAMDTTDLWENAQISSDFYRQRKRPVPREVRDAEMNYA